MPAADLVPVAVSSRAVDHESASTNGSDEQRLLSLLETMRRRRAEMTSLVEHAQELSPSDGHWQRALWAYGATFKWQRPSQYYGDLSQIMGGLFRVGCDGRDWWWATGSAESPGLALCPTNGMQLLNASLADPFGLTTDAPDQAVKALGLVYGGITNLAGARCYRIEARPVGAPSAPTTQWWINDQTLLVDQLEVGGSHARYLYDSVNTPLPASAFSPPRPPGVRIQGPETLDADYTQRFVDLRDGSDGRMSVRWGKTGPKARSSSGLN